MSSPITFVFLLVVASFCNCINSQLTSTSTHKPRMPNYIDTSAQCPKLYFSTNRVVQNCSAQNLAVNWTIQAVDMPFVTELLLSSNGFSASVPAVYLNQYESLQLLDLSSNFITESSEGLQAIDCTPKPLTELNLANNRFTRLPLLHPTCMARLRKLNLSRNSLLVNFDDPNTFSPAAVRLMPRLNNLDLSYCSIETLNRNNFTVLSFLPKLISLNLIGNRIRLIQPNPFLNIPYLNFLSFENNNLFCDDNLLWVKAWLSIKRNRICCDPEIPPVINPPIIDILDPPDKDYKPTCFSPLTLNNESVLTLPDPLFLIYIQLTTSIANPGNINVDSGAVVELDCSVRSRPGADLWWTFNDRVLTKTTSQDSPYEFIENFDASNAAERLNKTSKLRIRKSRPELQGKYTCNAFYYNYKPNQYLSIVSQAFQVGIRPALVVGYPWQAWQIALLVIGCILAFLLICLLIYCCVWCCCFRGGPFCCLPCCCCLGTHRQTKKKLAMFSSSSSELRYDLRSARNNLTEVDENQSGFRDASRKPNYVVNTISKGSSHSLSAIQSGKEFKDDSYLCNQLTTDNFADLNAQVIHSASSSALRHTTLLNQFQQQDLIDINLPVEDTKLYNTQAANLNSKTLLKSHHRPQVYSSINNPIDYGSTYNTNEGFLNDHSELHHQVRFTNDVIINDSQDHFFDNNDGEQVQFYSGKTAHFSMDPHGFSEDTTCNKQYYSSNYTHHTEITNNTSFVKYDSDV